MKSRQGVSTQPRETDRTVFTLQTGSQPRGPSSAAVTQPWLHRDLISS